MDATEVALAYYRALDSSDYERLRSLLAPEFRQERPDRTFEGREAFVAFMREGRPQTDTTHEVEVVFEHEENGRVAAEGRLVDAEGSEIVAFVDVFAFDEGGAVRELLTYTR